MLYIIGGAARSGKSTLAKRLNQELKIPYFSIDHVLISLEKGIPELGITHEQKTLERSPKMWLILKPMLINIYEAEPEYLVDGDMLLPKYIGELANEIEHIKVCYLGYVHVNPEEKLQSIRKYKGPNNWTKDLSDKKILELVERGIELSSYLEKEALEYGFRYFDTSSNFTDVIDKAFNYLVRA